MASIIILLYTAFFIVLLKIAFGDLREKLCGSSLALCVFVYVCLIVACRASMEL